MAEQQAPKLEGLGANVYGITQTPQVWLDHQVFEQDGALVLHWDAVEGLFPTGLLDDMFAAFSALLSRLASDPDSWRSRLPLPLPAHQQRERDEANSTAAPLPDLPLHALFARQAQLTPDAPALVAGDTRLTYGELSARVNRLARLLLSHPRFDASAPVAVVASRDWRQAVSPLAVLAAGGLYLPLDPAQPPARLARLLSDAGARLLLGGADAAGRGWPDDIEFVTVEEEALEPYPDSPVEIEVGCDRLAYLIYTSGSTGQPKGVAVTHRAAANTLLDINDRYAVGGGDAVLGLSSLGFDLSVYDLFGALAAGAKLVLAGERERRDPGRWAGLMACERVTVWDSVPALMQMLVEYLEGRPGEAQGACGSLRVALLSGDWIPVSLAPRLLGLAPSARVVGLGGATEAAVWSIHHEVDESDAGRRSVPYGRPLRNQRFHVLNARMEPCPVWVSGQLYVAGAGLAEGYWRDEEKTAASFLRHPVSGERLYRTGDWGRYLPGGEIEFEGREDSQVKVGGHRVELGEVEAALAEHEGVAECVVAAAGERRGARQLVAYVVPADVQPLGVDETGNTDEQTARGLSDNESEQTPLAAEPVGEAYQIPWAEVIEAGHERARQVPADIEILALTAQHLERLSINYVILALRKLGVYTRPGERYSTDGLIAQCGIQPRYQKLIGRWLKALEDEGLLKRDEDGAY
ncbi:MAG TPA: amino acid adenylation domain-containing protein, partial [Solirubrobacterales bacterium]